VLLRVTTTLIAFLIWAPAASAWSWPVQGPVLRPFAYDESHPYASGQHRGIDIGADATGAPVVAPASGTVTFAGTVPTSGMSVSIGTADGYSVTLTHLGSIAVVKGAPVDEGATVGTVGPSGTPELDGPYVHLGVRIAADENGYVDPLGLLPAPSAPVVSDAGSSAAQPVASGASSTATAPTAQPAPVATAPPVAVPEQDVQAASPHVSRPARRQASRADTRTQHSSRQTPVSRSEKAQRRVKHSPRTPRSRVSEPMSASRRPVVEAAAPDEPTGLDAGHELTTSVPLKVEPQRHQAPADWLGLACNGAAALIAVTAALSVGRRRRRRGTAPLAQAHVVRLPVLTVRERRAA
jgi:pyruvate/2-oxoglutarate dehydrogenase complex dihydrolipoamide acyltransferase (E2) component